MFGVDNPRQSVMFRYTLDENMGHYNILRNTVYYTILYQNKKDDLYFWKEYWK